MTNPLRLQLLAVAFLGAIMLAFHGVEALPDQSRAQTGEQSWRVIPLGDGALAAIPKTSGLRMHQNPFIAPVDDAAQNVSAAVTPGAAPDSIIVRGMVTGEHSYALVEDGGAERVVGVGDRLQGAAVRAITMQGVELDNGMRLLAKDGHGQ